MGEEQQTEILGPRGIHNVCKKHMVVQIENLFPFLPDSKYPKIRVWVKQLRENVDVKCDVCKWAMAKFEIERSE